MWMSMLIATSLCIGVFGTGTTEDPCDISAGIVIDFIDNPSNATVRRLLHGIDECSVTTTEVGLLRLRCQMDNFPVECEMFTNLVQTECVSFRRGQYAKTCALLVEALIAGNSYRDEFFPSVFKKVLEEIIHDADDPLFKVFEESCEEQRTETKNVQKTVIATCSTLGAWINAINATDQAIGKPENLRTFVSSVDDTYANMTRWHLRKKWNPDGTTLSAMYEQECSSQDADMYCQVLKEKLEAYQEECARDPSKCEETTTESNRAISIGAAFFLTPVVFSFTVYNKQL